MSRPHLYSATAALFLASAFATGIWFTGCASIHPPHAASAQNQASKLTGPSAPAAQERKWVWLDVPHARCANGEPTGVGLNLASSSNRLLVFMQGGGACSDTKSCYTYKTASFVDSGYNQEQFLVDLENLNHFMLTQNDKKSNPLYDAHWAYIPYCTGDVHTGNNVISYPDAPQTTYHLGAEKTRLTAEHLRKHFPYLDNIILAGSSAGAFGAVVHYGTFASIFEESRIDLISDSGENPLEPPSAPSWKSPAPYRCEGCNINRFSSYLPALAQAFPQSRFFALSFEQDTVLPRYLGLSVQNFAQEIHRYFKDIKRRKNVKTFLAGGSNHVVLNFPEAKDGAQSLRSSLFQWLNEPSL